jgi:hypothetical protein
VPNDPPTCWATRVMMLACGISSLARPVYDAAITGMVTPPSPMPRITSVPTSNQRFVCDPASANGTVAAATTSRPAKVTQRAPTASVSLPARVRVASTPRPCTPISNPARKALVPRTCWK